MLLKCFIQNGSKFRKFTGFHRTEEGQYSFQSQREIMPKNVQITTQLHSFHMLANYCSQSLKLGFNKQYLNWELPHVQTGFRKGRGTRDQIANIRWIIEKAREFHKNIYFCFIDYTKAFDCVDHNKLGKFWKRWEYHTTLPVSWEICMQVKKQQL